MSLDPPTFLPLASLRRMPVRHTWDDWDPYPQLGEQDVDTLSLLEGLTDRAQIAFSIACAEWVIWRFVDLCADRRPFEILEVSWAGELTDELIAPPQLRENEWQGPIRGPIDLSLVTVLNTFYSTEDGAGETEAAFAELIVLHVLTEHDEFLKWKAKVLERLTDQFRRTDADREGVPIPREMMDPLVPVSEESRVSLVKRFISTLDVTNSSLSSITNYLSRRKS